MTVTPEPTIRPKYRIFRAHEDWSTTDPDRPWKLLEQRPGDEDPRGVAECASWAEAIATMRVYAARAEYSATFGEESDAAVRRHDAHQRLFAAQMAAFEARLVGRDSAVSMEGLYELEMPCINCTIPLNALNAHRHEIVREGGRTPYARCNAQ